MEGNENTNVLTQEEIDYLVNLVESEEKKDWSKAKSDLDSDMHPDSIRKSFNVGKYSGYSVYKFMQDKIENNLLSDEEAIRLEALREKEYKERVKLQDANRERRKYLRDFSRVESLMEYIDKKLDERKPLSIDECTYTISNGNEASVLISDLHAGALVDSVFNYYDLDVMRERLNQLADKTIIYCKHNDVSKLNIELIGDFVSGIIHGSTIAESQEDIIDQIFSATDVIEMFIRKVAKEIPCIRVYSVYGNHGRVHPNKSDGSNKENFERLVTLMLKKDFRETNIKVIDNGYEDFVEYKLEDGRTIVISHGDKDSKVNANQIYSKLLKEDIFEVHLAHYHDYSEGNGITINGSVMASDSYAITLRKNTPAIQALKVYLNEDVVTYKIKLD